MPGAARSHDELAFALVGHSQGRRGSRVVEVEPGVQAALVRVQKRAAMETSTGEIGLAIEAAGTTDPWALRSFEDSPREEGELTVAADWVGQRFAWKFSAGLAANPDDGQEFRPDGSYVAMSLGNWNLSAGYLDRWWGPGWEGSLILSNNARPLPSIGIDRNEAKPFTWPVLRWLGPWRFSTFMGQLEEDRDYPNALLFGMRFESRPLPSLQIAASRSAQWCGEGRPCDLSTFGDLLTGNDNDQTAGRTARKSARRLRRALVMAGRTGAGRALCAGDRRGRSGVHALQVPRPVRRRRWGEWGSRSWRAHVEYADTACDFPTSPPEFGCAYTSSIYTSGYRYRGRAMGHTIDADGESIGAGLLLVEASGSQWNLLARNVKLNRAGVAAEHSLADGPATIVDVTLSHGRTVAWGNIGVLLGFADVSGDGTVAMEDGARVSLTWRYDLR